MVTEAPALFMRALLLAVLLLAAPGAARAVDGAAGTAVPALAHAHTLLAQQRYREAVELLEALLDAVPSVADVHLLLGTAYGRLAEREPWYRAIGYARRCGTALARAVELDPRHRDALAALALFYEQAPAFLGGGADKAVAVRQRLTALD